MKSKRIFTLLSAFTILLFSNNIYAKSMNEIFDEINATGNIGGYSSVQGQTMNHYAGGSAYVRTPNNTYNLAHITPPSYSAGCGGIDLYMGGFSFINKEQFVAMAKNIGSNALGYGFKLAIQNLCPTCDNVMQNLQQVTQAINRMNIDSCEAAKGIVNMTFGDRVLKGQEQSAMNVGTAKNWWSDMTDAWRNLKKSPQKISETNQRIIENNPSEADNITAKGNIVWRALQKANGLTNDEKMLMMSIIGTIIIDDDGKTTRTLPPVVNDLSMFVGSKDINATLNRVQLYVCDTTVDCKNPTIQEKDIPSFKSMVKIKLNLLKNAIAQRQDLGSQSKELMDFVYSVDIPVYKLIASTVRLNNTTVTDVVLENISDYIAAKYAKAYTDMIAKDVRHILTNYAHNTSSTAYSDSLQMLLTHLVNWQNKINSDVIVANTRMNVNANIISQIQLMEKAAMNVASEALRTSLIFGQSLQTK